MMDYDFYILLLLRGLGGVSLFCRLLSFSSSFSKQQQYADTGTDTVAEMGLGEVT